MKIIRATELRQGRWRNGMGVSWDIASDAEDFGWRLAIARIDADVPFSHYPDTSRFFTLIEGQGLELDFEGRETLRVNELFVPHAYPCDVPTYCRLRNGPCRALNLFLKRQRWRADVEVVSGNIGIAHDGPVLLFALDGPVAIDNALVGAGDAAIIETRAVIGTGKSRLYVARLSQYEGN